MPIQPCDPSLSTSSSSTVFCGLKSERTYLIFPHFFQYSFLQYPVHILGLPSSFPHEYHQVRLFSTFLTHNPSLRNVIFPTAHVFILLALRTLLGNYLWLGVLSNKTIPVIQSFFSKILIACFICAIAKHVIIKLKKKQLFLQFQIYFLIVHQVSVAFSDETMQTS